MKIAIIGAGGVGGYYGLKLAKAGNDVVFIARGAHLKAMQDQGLLIKRPNGDLHLDSVQATDNPSDLKDIDLILFCVKLWDTESAARAILPSLKPETAVISLQNGVTKDGVLKSILGPSHVLGGICYISSAIIQPGVIEQTGTIEKLLFGEYGGEKTKRAEALLDTFREADIDAYLSEDIERTIWEKFVYLAAFSGLTSATRLPVGRIRENPKTRKLLLEMMQEVLEVGLSKKVALPSDFAIREMDFIDTLPYEMTSSMLKDLEKGRRLEVDWLSGSVVEMGKLVEVDTPINYVIHALLQPFANGKLDV